MTSKPTTVRGRTSRSERGFFECAGIAAAALTAAVIGVALTLAKRKRREEATGVGHPLFSKWGSCATGAVAAGLVACGLLIGFRFPEWEIPGQVVLGLALVAFLAFIGVTTGRFLAHYDVQGETGPAGHFGVAAVAIVLWLAMSVAAVLGLHTGIDAGGQRPDEFADWVFPVTDTMAGSFGTHYDANGDDGLDLLRLAFVVVLRIAFFLVALLVATLCGRALKALATRTVRT